MSDKTIVVCCGCGVVDSYYAVVVAGGDVRLRCGECNSFADRYQPVPALWRLDGQLPEVQAALTGNEAQT